MQSTSQQLPLNDLLDEIREESQQLSSSLALLRRTIHSNPELSNQEYDTQKLILSELSKFPPKTFVFVKKVANTGVVALLRGTGGDPSDTTVRTVLLRADMDALPMPDKKTTAYASKNEGVCHACGHDVHVTCLLGAINLLVSRRDQFGGRILCVFQPAEEVAGGGRRMVSLGVCGAFTRDDTGETVPSLLKVTRYNREQSRILSASENEEEDEENDSELGLGGELAEPVEDLPPNDVIPGTTRLRRRAGWVDGKKVSIFFYFFFKRNSG
jgi:hypothetical protein